MSLYGILNVGSTALAVQQAALQVTGNNLANAADPNYDREVVNESPGIDVPTDSGQLLGSGVEIDSIQRQVDLALQSRLNNSVSDQSAASTLQTWAGQIQTSFNALSGNGLSDQLNTFFNDWSTLANNPGDTGQSAIVVKDGETVAQTLNTLSGNLSTLSTNVQQSVGAQVEQVNQLTGDIASLNGQIVATQASGGQANTLLDQRDAYLNQLSTLTNVQTITQPTGSVNVYAGSEPLVLGTTAQTLTSGTISNNGQLSAQVTFQDGSVANFTSGSLGGLQQSQQLIDSTGGSLDSLASNLISSLNSLHTSGQGLEGFTSVTSTNKVSDATQPLNGAGSGLDFPVQSGSFVLTQTDATTGLSTSTLVQVNESGTSDTTLNSLASTLNGISGVSATINNGQLTIQSSNSDDQLSFSQDTSGALSALGINTFFTGSSAGTIGVNSQLQSNTSLLATSADGIGVDSKTAQAIANLNDAPQSALNGNSLSGTYGALVESIGSAASTATNNATTASTVQESLQAQQQALSGVSTDQEALNMIVEQRTYQGAAEFISKIDATLQSLLAIT